MPTLTLSQLETLYPAGTVLSAYKGSLGTAPPSGPAAETAVVGSDGRVTFATLADETPYTVIGAKFDGQPHGIQTRISSFHGRLTWQQTVAARRAGVTPVALAVNIVPPVIGGALVASLGALLTCTTGTWANATVLTAQWLRDGVAIAGATGFAYEVVGEDTGATLTCAVTASNTAGTLSAPAVSSNSMVVAAFLFVDPSGSDVTGTGALSAPVRTIAKLVTLLTSGKTGCLKRGGRWKETLTIPANLVTVGAYGAAATVDADGYITNAPVLDGGEFLTGFAAYTGGDETRQFADTLTGTAGTDLVSHTADVGGSWSRHDAFNSASVNALVISNANRARRKTGTSLALYYETLTLSVDDYYSQATTFVASLDTDSVEALARGFSYTDKGYWARVSTSGVLAIGKRIAGTNTTSSNGSFTVAGVLGAGLVVGDSYTIRVEVEGSTIRGYVNHNGGSFVLFDTWTDTAISTGDHAMLKMGSGSAVAPDDTHGLHVDAFECGPLGTVGSPVNTFKSTGAVGQVYQLEIDGQLALKGPDVDQLANGQWFWQGNRLYLRRDAGAPGATDVVLATRSLGIDVAAHTDVRIDGVAFEHQGQRAITSTLGAHRLTVRRAMVQRGCNAERGLNGCIGIYGNGCTVMDSVVRDVDNDGIYANVPPGAAPQILRNLLGPVSGFGSDCCQIDSSEAATVSGLISGNHFRMTSANTPKGCLILFGGGYTVENNFFEGTGSSSLGTGAYGVSLAGNDDVVRNNIFYNHPNDAIRSSSNVPGTPRSNHSYYGNITVDCGQAIHAGLPSSNFLIYANTFVNVNRRPQFQAIDDYAVHAYSTITGEFKDNVVWDASGSGKALKLDAAATSFARDYNTIGPEGTAFISDNGSAFATLAAYVAAKSMDAHSVHVDAMFANLGGHVRADYVPALASPAVGSGVLVPGYVHVRDMGAVTVTPPSPDPPSNLTAPTVTGFAIDGYSVSAKVGVWESGDVPTFTYQWRRCDASGASCADLAGATAATYACVTADVGSTLRCAVTATNPFGSATVVTAQSLVVSQNVDPSTNPDIVTDAFTDTTGTVLSAHTPDGAGLSYVKHPVYTPTAVITASGRARQNGGAGVSSTTLYRNLTVPPTASYDVRASIYVASISDVAFRTGVVARCDPTADTWYGVRYSGANGQWELLRLVAGVGVVLDAYPIGVAVGSTVSVLLVVRDAIKRAFIDGVEQMVTSDNTITAAGFAGIRLGDDGGTDGTGLQVDSFRVVPA